MSLRRLEDGRFRQRPAVYTWGLWRRLREKNNVP